MYDLRTREQRRGIALDLDKFIEVGGNFLDTANVYAAGASEEILGRALKHHRRDDLVIATKVRFNAKLFTGGKVGPNEWGLFARPHHGRGREQPAPSSSTTSISTRCIVGL